MASVAVLQSIKRVALSTAKDAIENITQHVDALLAPAGQVSLDIVGRTSQAEDLSPSFVWAKNDDCKKLEERKKLGPVCRSPDMRKKSIPPYQYGYCKEQEPELPMSCPPKMKKRGKGPCCHEAVTAKTGGCKTIG